MEDSEWSYISETETMVISPKESVTYDQLVLLLCWLKSNIFTWDLLWNKNKTSVYSDQIIKDIMIPNVEGEKRIEILSSAKELLFAEKQFVSQYNIINEKGLISESEEEKDKFNKKALVYLQKIETAFSDFYHISEKDVSTIAHEIKLKGYFSYMQQ